MATVLGSSATATVLRPIDSRGARSRKESAAPVPVKLHAKNLNFHYGSAQALYDVTLAIPECRVTALIGPSGCGKSTFLRTLNRMGELTAQTRLAGTILLDGRSVLDMEAIHVRRRIGMVFQRPNPFPKSIFENVAYGVRVNGLRNGRSLDEIVETSLKKAALWDEVKDKLHTSAMSLSGGQQQRLCIARAFAVDPEVLLLDEPCSALDPISTARIEEVILQLRGECTIVIVTHNLQQAARVSDRTAFFLLGRLIESGDTVDMFERPQRKETQDYVTGRMG